MKKTKAKRHEAQLIKKLHWQDAKDTEKKDVMAGRVFRSVYDPSSGYSYITDEINISVSDNGAISFFDDCAESHIYFYPDQLKFLSKALQFARRARKGMTK